MFESRDAAYLARAHARRATRRRQLQKQGPPCAADCLPSDSSSDDVDLARSLDVDRQLDPGVDDETPALVEVAESHSSASDDDCALPYHQLVTYSPPTQLAKGLVKVLLATRLLATP